MDGRQTGDPRKGVAAIIKIAEMAEPPLRLVLGREALAILRHAYQSSADELERWAHISRSTDFDGQSPSDVVQTVLKL